MIDEVTDAVSAASIPSDSHDFDSFAIAMVVLDTVREKHFDTFLNRMLMLLKTGFESRLVNPLITSAERERRRTAMVAGVERLHQDIQNIAIDTQTVADPSIVAAFEAFRREQDAHESDH